MYIITTNGTQVHLTTSHKCIIIHPNVILLTQNSKRMTRIQCGFDPTKKVYSVGMEKFTEKELKKFCELFLMDIEDLKCPKSGNYILLGRIALCMIPKTIKKIKEENDHFPIKKVGRIDPSYSKNMVQENVMYLEDDLVFRIQIINHKDKEYLSRIEISRDEYITFAGLFKISEKVF